MRRKIKGILSLCFGILILVFMAVLGGEETFQKILSVPIQAIFISLAIYSVSWLLRTQRMKMLLKAKDTDFRKIFEINIAGYFGNIVLPAKAGDALRAASFIDKSIEAKYSISGVIFSRIQDLLAISIILIVFIPFSFYFGLPTFLFVSLGVVLGAILLFFFLFVFRRGILLKLFKKVEKLLAHKIFESLKGKSEEVFDTLESYFSFRNFSSVLSYSFAIWILEVLVALVIGYFLGAQINLALFFVAVSFGNIAKTVPATPGGIGFYEGAMASVLSLGGIAYPLAFTISLVEHVLKNAFILILGSYFFSREGIDLTMKLKDNF